MTINAAGIWGSARQSAPAGVRVWSRQGPAEIGREGDMLHSSEDIPLAPGSHASPRLASSQRPFRLRYHLIIVDTMGHGEVSWPPEEFSLGRTAGHLHELLRWLRAGPAFWVGISIGPVIAMRVALSNPCWFED